VLLEGLGKLKQSTSSGTLTGDFPTLSIVPQPTTLPRATLSDLYLRIFSQVVNFLEHEADYSHSSSAHVKSVRRFIPFRVNVHGAVLNYT
jgi:hypothetical protein